MFISTPSLRSLLTFLLLLVASCSYEYRLVHTKVGLRVKEWILVRDPDDKPSLNDGYLYANQMNPGGHRAKFQLAAGRGHGIRRFGGV